jgi:HAE1 family hydrophobic/amphiphilic exporter-1
MSNDPNIDQVLTQMRRARPSQVAADGNYGVTVKKSTAASPEVVDLISRAPGDATFLANYAYINLNDQMTGAASPVSASRPANMPRFVRVDQLAKLNITIPEIVDAIQKQNTVNPSGQGRSRPPKAKNTTTPSAPRPAGKSGGV